MEILGLQIESEHVGEHGVQRRGMSRMASTFRSVGVASGDFRPAFAVAASPETGLVIDRVRPVLPLSD
jgi:hypothetical protein